MYCVCCLHELNTWENFKFRVFSIHCPSIHEAGSVLAIVGYKLIDVSGTSKIHIDPQYCNECGRPAVAMHLSYNFCRDFWKERKLSSMLFGFQDRLTVMSTTPPGIHLLHSQFSFPTSRITALSISYHFPAQRNIFSLSSNIACLSIIRPPPHHLLSPPKS